MSLEDTCSNWNRLELANPPSEIGVNGADVGLPGYAAGKFGNGLVVNTNDSVRFLNTGNVFNQPVGMHEQWMKPVGYSLTNAIPGDGGTKVFMSLATSSSNIITWYFGVGGMVVIFNDAGVYGGFGSGSFQVPEIDVADGEWFHTMIAWDEAGINGGDETVQVYFNAAKVAATENALTVPTIGTNIYMHIGAYIVAGPRLGWDGMIDNPKRYNSTEFLAGALANKDNEAWPAVGGVRLINGGLLQSNMLGGNVLIH